MITKGVTTMRESLLDFCRRTQREELLREWDNERNAPLTPATVSHGSKKHVWWCCANGHSWQAAVHARTGSGAGCPYCAGRYAIAGETDLATTYPALAKEWHPEKNGDLTPSQGAARQSPPCLVVLCQRPRMARADQIAGEWRRLSRLRQQTAQKR